MLRSYRRKLEREPAFLHGTATRLLTEIDELVSAEEPDLARLAQLKLSLDEKLQTLRGLDSEILDDTEDDDLEEEIQQSDRFKEKIYAAIVKMDGLRSRPTGGEATASAGTRTDRDERVKLPKLELQPFSGDITIWSPFWDSCNSAIHQNSRPLTYLSSDELEEPLTPAHLLTGRRLLTLPDAIYSEDVHEDYEVTPALLTRRLTYLNNLLNKFWRQWQSEYLLELREAHRYGRKTANTEAVNVGDVVLVHEDGKPHAFWKLARVMDLIVGRDGQTRGAILKVASSG